MLLLNFLQRERQHWQVPLSFSIIYNGCGGLCPVWHYHTPSPCLPSKTEAINANTKGVTVAHKYVLYCVFVQLNLLLLLLLRHEWPHHELILPLISDITLQWLIQHSKSRRSWKCTGCVPAAFAMLPSYRTLVHSATMYSRIVTSRGALFCSCHTIFLSFHFTLWFFHKPSQCTTENIIVVIRNVIGIIHLVKLYCNLKYKQFSHLSFTPLALSGLSPLSLVYNTLLSGFVLSNRPHVTRNFPHAVMMRGGGRCGLASFPTSVKSYAVWSSLTTVALSLIRFSPFNDMSVLENCAGLYKYQASMIFTDVGYVCVWIYDSI